MPKKTTPPGPSLWLSMVSRQQGLQPPGHSLRLVINPSSEQVCSHSGSALPKHKQHCLLPYFLFHLRPKPQRIVYLSSFYFFGLWLFTSHVKLCSSLEKPLKQLSSRSLVICGHRLLSGCLSPWLWSSPGSVPFSCQESWPLSASWVLCSLGSGHFIDFSRVSMQLINPVQLVATPQIAAHQASLSFTISQSLLKFVSTKSVMPSNHLMLCLPLLLLPSTFPSISDSNFVPSRALPRSLSLSVPPVFPLQRHPYTWQLLQHHLNSISLHKYISSLDLCSEVQTQTWHLPFRVSLNSVQICPGLHLQFPLMSYLEISLKAFLPSLGVFQLAHLSRFKALVKQFPLPKKLQTGCLPVWDLLTPGFHDRSALGMVHESPLWSTSRVPATSCDIISSPKGNSSYLLICLVTVSPALYHKGRDPIYFIPLSMYWGIHIGIWYSHAIICAWYIFFKRAAHMLSDFSSVQLLATLWTVARQAPLSMGFSRQEDCSKLPCSLPGDLPHPEIKPMSLTFPTLAGKFFTTSTTWKAHIL